jgi:hypothetical protein
VKCEVAKFTVRLNATMQRITIQGGVASAANPPIPPRTIVIPTDRQVNGLALTFACVSPSSALGCL